MASIRKHGEGYQVCIRSGKYKYKALYKTFSKKTVAERWAKEVEIDIERGVYLDSRNNSNILVSNLLQRYYDTTTNKSPSTRENESYILARLTKELAQETLDTCDAERLFTYFQTRRQHVTADTLIKDISFLTSMFRMAQIIWKLPIKDNPAKEARSMASQMGLLDDANLMHDRTLSDEEYALFRGYQPKRFGVGKYGALFLIATGMRRGEMCEMKWQHIDWINQLCELPTQKSDHKRKRVGKGRLVPLTRHALAIIRLVCYLQKKKRQYDPVYVWPWRDHRSCSKAIRRIVKMLGIKSLRVHDLRHDFGSVQTDAEVDIRLVAAMMGHQDLRSIKRYSHPNMKKVAAKIAGR